VNGSSPEPEHVDVLIVGAGLTGVGAACQLSERCPQKSFAILEAREAMGGTWDLFRYPGIRSDSDMFTLGYSFRPWEEAKAIADGPSILRYIETTAREYGVDSKIRYGHRVVSADFSKADGRWTVEVERADTGETTTMTCGFFHACTGYYRYDEGFSPQFEGRERFRGDIVHPQHWPEGYDYSGKRVVVIGSGATAVTLVPAMAGEAEHVTMLQRSPSYIVALPGTDPLATFLHRILPKRLAYPLLRWKGVLMTQLSFQLSRRRPKVMKAFIRRGVQRALPGHEIDPHFKPKYNPWDQRMCLVPDGDLFRALRHGDASIVTDEIESFTENGIQLASGEHLDADLVITATGLNVLLLGGIEVSVDGEPVEPGQTVAYKGMMFSGVPNLAVVLGYTNASWTLKCDLVSAHVCRMLNHMDANGYDVVTPIEPPESMPREPLIDLKSGYVLRAIDQVPRQGDRTPWRLHQNYPLDIHMLKRGPIEGEGIEFSTTDVREPVGV
jgi:cation diffusion facilitator CzcD-associated flavoprotein CzcO